MSYLCVQSAFHGVYIFFTSYAHTPLQRSCVLMRIIRGLRCLRPNARNVKTDLLPQQNSSCDSRGYACTTLRPFLFDYFPMKVSSTRQTECFNYGYSTSSSSNRLGWRISYRRIVIRNVCAFIIA